MTQSVQNTGKCSGQVEERTQKRKNLDKSSRVLISIDQRAQQIAEKEKDSAGKNSQQKAVFHRFFRGRNNFFPVSFRLFLRDGGKKHGRYGIGDGGRKENEGKRHSRQDSIDTKRLERRTSILSQPAWDQHRFPL